MALKNVSGAASRAALSATTSATANAKGAANSTASTVLSNSGAPESSATPLAGDFLSVLAGIGAQTPSGAPPTPTKQKQNAAPANLAPPATTGTASAAPPTALLATAPVATPSTLAAPSTVIPTATPNAQLTPSVAESNAQPLTSTPDALPPTAAVPMAQPQPSSPPPAASTAPPPAVTPPTLMPAPAAPATTAASRAPAVNAAATATNIAKPGKSSSVAATATDADAEAPAPAPESSATWLLPGMRVPTLQPAASVAAGASTLMSAAVTGNTEESEPAAAADATETTTGDDTPDTAKSVTQAAVQLNADAPAAATLPNLQPSTPADDMANATAAAAAAQAGPLHNAVHSQSSMAAAPVLRASVGSTAWTEELGTQLTLMARHGQDSAMLHLSPEHLGPVDVRIDVRDGATSVWFGAAHADTRSALEQSLPRLREMFAASGLLLADAGVARDAPRQNARPVAALPLSGNAADPSVSNSEAARASTHAGLVDTYA